MSTTERHPWSYASGKREAEAWSQFGAGQFPNYERFWQLFAVPRTRRAWHLAFLPDVSPLDRKTAWLNQRISVRLYRVQARLNKQPKAKGLTPMQYERELRRQFIVSLRGMAHMREDIELFLFLALFATKRLPESHPIYQAYVQRVAEHKAAVEAANAPFKGRLLSLDDIPPHTPFTAILPEEVAVVTESYDLTNLTRLIRHTQDLEREVDALPSFHRKHWSLLDRPEKPQELAAWIADRDAAMQADEPAIQQIVVREGGDTMHGLATKLATDLTAEINQIYGNQVIPMVEKVAQPTQNEPTKTV